MMKTILLSLILAGAFLNAAIAQDSRSALKVCADPNSMPLSHQDQTGYENQIAMLLADKLGLPLEMTWFPQRRGFVRKTLRAKDPNGHGFRCDLIIGVPKSFELGMTTDPYYRSTYALVFKTDGPLADIESADDLANLSAEQKQNLRIGVFEQSQAAVWLARHDMILQIVPYITLNADPDAYPGQVIENELQNDAIDAAILWGPIAGYFVAKQPGLKLLPMHSVPGIRFDFPIAMAVRFGDGEWRQQIQTLIDENRAEIEAILNDFHVPLVAIGGTPL